MDVRARAATLFLRCFVSLNLRVGGFASRHLKRWVSREPNATPTKAKLFDVLQFVKADVIKCVLSSTTNLLTLTEET
jgi:hypothetical protein